MDPVWCSVANCDHRLTEEEREELRSRTRVPGVMPRTRDRLEMVRLSDAGWSIPIHLFSLPAYSPELSRMEPIWQEIQCREWTPRRDAPLRVLKQAVDHALARKAIPLRQSAQSLNRTT